MSSAAALCASLCSGNAAGVRRRRAWRVPCNEWVERVSGTVHLRQYTYSGAAASNTNNIHNIVRTACSIENVRVITIP